MTRSIWAKLGSGRGLSSVELLCTVVIAVAILAMAAMGTNIYAKKTATGNDRLAMETAQSVANTNLHGGSIFSDASADDDQELPQRGYFEPERHTIVRHRPAGYNDASVVTSQNGTMYTSAPNTMVICVEYDGAALNLFWTESSR